jgi:lysophospholipase L1-like esterase
MAIFAITQRDIDSQNGMNGNELRLPSGPIVWAALGDSYSAGIGGSTPTTRRKGCERDDGATFASRSLRQIQIQDPSVRIELRLAACSGDNTKDLRVNQLNAAKGASLVTMTVGGNDLGFTDILVRCVLVGCPSTDQPSDDLVGLKAASGLSGWETLEDRLKSLFVDIQNAMVRGGSLVLLQYPVPFLEAPDRACSSGIVPFGSDDQALSNAAVVRLNSAIQTAARDAADQVRETGGTANITVLEWQQPTPVIKQLMVRGRKRSVAFNPHGACTALPMVNGVSLTGEFTDSFHPTDEGHQLVAEILAKRIMAALRSR